jgi:hypothetical protein
MNFLPLWLQSEEQDIVRVIQGFWESGWDNACVLHSGKEPVKQIRFPVCCSELPGRDIVLRRKFATGETEGVGP